jgi:hypothetical protein
MSEQLPLEEHSATSELSSMISVLVFSEYLDLLLGPGPNNEIILIFSTSLFVNVYCCNDSSKNPEYYRRTLLDFVLYTNVGVSVRSPYSPFLI